MFNLHSDYKKSGGSVSKGLWRCEDLSVCSHLRVGEIVDLVITWM